MASSEEVQQTILKTKILSMMVARYRRTMALRPIRGIKHIVDSRQTLAAATTLSVDVIVADESPTVASTNQVMIGSRVNGIYLRVEANVITASAGAIPSCYMHVIIISFFFRIKFLIYQTVFYV